MIIFRKMQLERLSRATGRDIALNRDIDIALGRSLPCDSQLRHDDGFVTPLHRQDYVVPPNYTGSIEAALGLVPDANAPLVLLDAINACVEPKDWKRALASKIAHRAIVGLLESEFELS